MSVFAWSKVSEAFQFEQKKAGSLDTPIVPAYSAAGRVAVNARTSREQAIIGFFDQHRLHSRDRWERALSGSWTAQVQSSLEKLQIGANADKSSDVTDRVKMVVAKDLILLVYDHENVEDANFGRVREEEWAREVARAFSLETRAFSRGMWKERAVRDVLGFEEEDIGDGSHCEAIRRSDNTAREAFNRRTANPYQNKPGDSQDKEELGNSMNWFQSSRVAGNYYVLDRAHRAACAVDWNPLGRDNSANWCCLFQSVSMLVGAKGLFEVPSINPDDPDISDLQAEIDSGTLTDQQVRDRQAQIARRADVVGKVLGMLKFFKRSAQMLQFTIERRQQSQSIDFGQILLSSLLPMAQKVVADVYAGFESSTSIEVAGKDFLGLKQALRDVNVRVNRDVEASTTDQVAQFSGDEDFNDIVSIIAKCGPAVDILDTLVFPTIEGVRELFEDILYDLYKRTIRYLSRDFEFSNAIGVEDRINFLDSFIKWVEMNVDGLIRNPHLCTSVTPSQADIDSFTDLIKHGLWGDERTPIVSDVESALEHIIDPSGFDQRLQELRSKVGRTEDEDQILETMENAKTIWVL